MIKRQSEAELLRIQAMRLVAIRGLRGQSLRAEIAKVIEDFQRRIATVEA
jgi:hypothetical protein